MRQPMLNLRQSVTATASPTALAANPTVSSEYLRLLALGAEGRGLNLTPIFASSGIDPAVLNRRGARVGLRAVDRVWSQLASRIDDRLFGLRLIDSIPFGAGDLMDYVIRTSANVGEALQNTLRCAPLLSTADHLQLVVSGNRASMRIHTVRDQPQPIELILSMFAERARGHFGSSWSLKQVSFAHEALGPLASYDSVFQVPVRFGMPFTEAVFERDLLDMPMQASDPRLNAILTAQANELLATVPKSTAAPSFVETIKQALTSGLSIGDFTLNGLADHLGLGARTLQRRLRAEGLTHRSLVRRLRHEMAVRSLAMPVTQNQIARTLGYSGTGAFQRAFKAWSGVSPAKLRRKRTRTANGHGNANGNGAARSTARPARPLKGTSPYTAGRRPRR
jgi:AraC-like DNA-binding protein